MQPPLPSQILLLPQLTPPAIFGCVHEPPLHRSSVHEDPSSVHESPSVERVQPAVSVCVGDVHEPLLHTWSVQVRVFVPLVEQAPPKLPQLPYLPQDDEPHVVSSGRADQLDELLAVWQLSQGLEGLMAPSG